MDEIKAQLLLHMQKLFEELSSLGRIQRLEELEPTGTDLPKQLDKAQDETLNALCKLFDTYIDLRIAQRTQVKENYENNSTEFSKEEKEEMVLIDPKRILH